MYQVDCSVLLDGKKFYEMSIWNMYCRKKSYVFLTAVMYAFSMLMISSALPQILTGTNNTAIINGGMGFVLLVLVVYMNYNHISRFKRASKNEEWLKKTGKHIRITKEQIVNYRIRHRKSASMSGLRYLVHITVRKKLFCAQKKMSRS